MSQLPSNLTPVREAHVFDEQRLIAYMQANVEGFRGPVQVLQFEGGQSNPTFHVADAGGRMYVLRKKPPGKLLPSAHQVDREYRVIKALYDGATSCHVATEMTFEDGRKAVVEGDVRIIDMETYPSRVAAPTREAAE